MQSHGAEWPRVVTKRYALVHRRQQGTLSSDALEDMRHEATTVFYLLRTLKSCKAPKGT
jgi:hypothetical protein